MRYWEKKIYLLDDFSPELRATDNIVTTNGCFDLLHIGHLENLYKCSQLGDQFLIGLNSDLSVKALKGESRPIFDQYTRASLLAALPFVDLVLIFDELNPTRLLETVQPLIHCKGSDYKDRAHEIPEFETMKKLGGRLEFIDLIHGYSTTEVANKIESLRL